MPFIDFPKPDGTPRTLNTDLISEVLVVGSRTPNEYWTKQNKQDPEVGSGITYLSGEEFTSRRPYDEVVAELNILTTPLIRVASLDSGRIGY